MSAAEATVGQIKKKFAAALPGMPFYPDLVEEVIREDYSKEGAALRERILKQLAVPDNKPKTAKAAVSFKSILVEGLQAISSASAALGEIGPKLDENKQLLENRHKNFWEKMRQVLQQMLNKEPDPIIYEVEYLDTAKGSPVREKVDFLSFRTEMDRKCRSLTTLGAKASAAARTGAPDETQLMGYLEKSIREVQSLHKILNALDEFFKTAVDRENRDKIRGTKPELATIKNAIIKANQKRHEYSAQKEEEEQLKRLGVSSGV
jgi:hypothetical protein